MMETRLRHISDALAQSAVDSYNRRPTLVYLTGITDNIVRLVYNELLIGAVNKTNDHKLAKNITKVALFAYWRGTGASLDHERLRNIENETLFHQATIATHATLKKMIKQTNYNRLLGLAMSR